MSVNFSSDSHPKLESGMWDEIKCGACVGALEGACAGLVIGGAIITAPEEITAAGVVAALAVLGFEVSGKKVIDWLVEAAKIGIKTVHDLAKFICKKVGACS